MDNTTIAIPKGWEIETNSEITFQVISSVPDSCSNKYVSKKGNLWFKEPSTDFREEWSGFVLSSVVTKVGDPKEGHSTASAKYFCWDGMQYAKHNDVVMVIKKIAPHYFSFWEPLPGYENHDICSYCGESNGESGELRHGYDCWNCGSN